MSGLDSASDIFNVGPGRTVHVFTRDSEGNIETPQVIETTEQTTSNSTSGSTNSNNEGNNSFFPINEEIIRRLAAQYREQLQRQNNLKTDVREKQQEMLEKQRNNFRLEESISRVEEDRLECPKGCGSMKFTNTPLLNVFFQETGQNYYPIGLAKCQTCKKIVADDVTRHLCYKCFRCICCGCGSAQLQEQKNEMRGVIQEQKDILDDGVEEEEEEEETNSDLLESLRSSGDVESVREILRQIQKLRDGNEELEDQRDEFGDLEGFLNELRNDLGGKKRDLEEEPTKCPKCARLLVLKTRSECKWGCNVCNGIEMINSEVQRYVCDPCGYDVHVQCYNRKVNERRRKMEQE